jgi:SAM-dependent methyltransferase
MSTVTQASGSADRWGPLWDARARDWAEVEEQQAPTYEEALRQVGLEAGQEVLEVGCGSGVFLRRAADRGARVYGIDASERLFELARARVPEADLRVGDMQFLPYEDDRFDLVVGFNSFFFAQDIVAALREAGRVARPGAPVLVQVWGNPERCAIEAVKAIMRPYMPPPPPGAPAAFDLWQAGVLESIATEAGLTPERTFDVSWAYEYPDEESLGRAMVAPAGAGELVGPSREPQLRQQIVAALEPYRTEAGYRLGNEFHCLVARAA